MSSLLDKIKQLQEATDCSFYDANSRLTATNGDIDAAIISILEEKINEGKPSEEHVSLEDFYQAAVNFQNEERYVEAADAFNYIRGYKDAKKRMEECHNCENERLYQEATKLLEEGDLQAAAGSFEVLGDYKDSKEQFDKIIDDSNEQQYQAALAYQNNQDYQAAIDIFEKIKDYQDSNQRIMDCQNAINEEVYQCCLLKKPAKSSNDELLSSIEILESLAGYKDSEQLRKKYQGILKGRKKAKRKAVGLTISGIALLLAGALAVNYFILLPNNHATNAATLLRDGKYQEADEVLSKFSNFNNNETTKYRALSKAALAFKKGNTEEGIKFIYNAGGEVKVNYDTNGGKAMSPRIIKKGAFAVEYGSEKNGYNFIGWTVDDFSFDLDNFKVDLTLKAQYDLATFSIKYEVGGGFVIQNPNTLDKYTLETDYELQPASKDGYTFIEWQDQNGQTVDNLLGHYGNLVLTPIFNSGNTLTLTLDPNGGELSSLTFDVQYGQPYTLPIPTRANYAITGWDLDGRKIPASGTWNYSTTNCSISAIWENALTISNNRITSINRDITSLHVDENILAISTASLAECMKLKYIDVDENNTSFSASNGILYDKHKTSLICVPKGMEIEEFTVPNTVTGMDDKALSYLAGLKKLVLSENLASVPGSALSGCSSLEELTIPYVGGLPNYSTSQKETLFGYIFGSYQYENSTSISQHTQEYNYLTSYIPNNLKKVTVFKGKLMFGAFMNCSMIEEINLSDGVTSIGKRAFYECESLKVLNIGTGLSSFDLDAFNSLFNTELEINFDENNEYFVKLDGIYYHRDPLSLFYVPESVTGSVNFPEGLETVSKSAFKSYTKITSIHIPKSVINIEEGAFSSCSMLGNITVDSENEFYCSVDGVLYTKDMKTLLCFPAQKNGSFNVPNEVTRIADYSFSGSGVTSVSIPNSVKVIGVDAFNYCHSLENVTISPGLITISEGAFSYSNLQSINIPYTVTTIGRYAFASTNLKTIFIPNSVTSIGYYAFYGCDDLTKIYCEATYKPSGWDNDWAKKESGGNYSMSHTVVWGYAG